MQLRDIFALEGLADLGSRSGVDMRPTLLRMLTDLYVHRLIHTATEERHYTELALRLLEAVDVPSRIAVARRFTHYPSPPLRVLQWLAHDLPEVAAELRSHPLLPRPTPAEAAVATGIAPTVPEHAAERGERLADIAPALDAATAGELNDLFFTASAEERRLILLNLDIVVPGNAQPSRVLQKSSVARRLEAAALTGNRDDFARQLAHALHIPREQAQRIARDDLGEPVAIAGKVLAMPRDVVYRVLMFLNPVVGHSVECVHALAALYDEMTMPAAEGMLAIWQSLQGNEHAAARHQTVVWDDETRRRLRSTTPVHRSPAAARTTARRSAS
jgi:hypothetical protein